MADTPTDTPKRRRAPVKPTTPRVARKAPATVVAELPKSDVETASIVTVTVEEKPKAAPRRKPPPKASAVAAAPAANKPKAKPRRSTRRSPAARPVEPQRAVSRPAATPAETPVKMGGVFAALGALAALGGALWVWRTSRAEEPGYRVVESDGAIDIRAYPPLVTAATTHSGLRKDALNKGFHTLADYIFAKSRPGKKIAMTAPVLADGDPSGWRTRFIMPGDTARALLPAAPAGVELVSEPARRVAAISFSGRADDTILGEKETALRSWLQSKSLPSEGKAIHAFYNAPYLPGPLRRNEVMVVLSEQGGAG